MKVKTSVTLSSGLLEQIDRVDKNRSFFLERAAQDYLLRHAKAERDAKDAAILKRNAESLNREATDVLEYQEFPD